MRVSDRLPGSSSNQRAVKQAEHLRALITVKLWLGVISAVVLVTGAFVVWIAFIALCVRIAQAWGWA